MLTDPIEKVDAVSSRGLFCIAAGLVFICQLLALVLVVNGQVEKAQHRTAQYDSARMAIADCAENHLGPARSQCIEQVNAMLDPYATFIAQPEPRTVSSIAAQRGVRRAPETGSGFMTTTFASRQ
ncbi:MAG: hypothetical protein JWR68_3125 [Polaromonas sp.]|nr:hypothetical protein [Polaromonas sp.]